MSPYPSVLARVSLSPLTPLELLYHCVGLSLVSFAKRKICAASPLFSWLEQLFKHGGYLPVAVVCVCLCKKNQKEKLRRVFCPLLFSCFPAVSSHIYGPLLNYHCALHAPASLDRFVTRVCGQILGSKKLSSVSLPFVLGAAIKKVAALPFFYSLHSLTVGPLAPLLWRYGRPVRHVSHM